MLLLQLNEATAAQRRVPFYAVDIVDGFTPETGLSSFVVDVSENGGARASGGGSDPTEIDATNMPGYYYYEATAAELSTVGFLAISIKHANMRDFLAIAQVIAFDPYSATNLGLTNLDTSITSRAPANEYDTELDAVISSRSSHTANNVRDAILSDSTPFAGSNINATISSRSSHSAADIWTAGSRELSTPANYMANVSALALEATVAALNNITAASVWAVGTRALTDKIDFALTAADKLLIADDVWDEDIVTAHDAADSAGLLLEVLGDAISDRANNANLNALLGVPDTAGTDIPEQVWSEGTRAITDKAGFTISGTITTFDGMDTNLDIQHGAGSWLTGGAGAGANILVIPSIPKNIDLADTKAVRIALYLTDQNDDLPTVGEITPGTIKIDRSADGGTSWTIIRNDVACSEHAGAIYYDEIFSSGNGYASADMIRITFKGQIVTISANNHEITDGTDGMVFITRMDSGLSGGGPSAGDIADAVWEEAIVDHSTSTTFGGKNQLVVPSETIADYKATGFSVHSPADVWTAGSRTLTTPNDYKADVSALATEANATTNTSNIQTNIDANETKIDLIISDTDRLNYGSPPSVWLDDTAANTNTVLGTDGVPWNPVSTLAAALTIAATLNVQSLTLMNNSSISLSQSFANWEIIGFGHDNIVTLNSQNVDNARLFNVQVTGTQGGTISVLFDHCHLDSIIGLNAHAIFCHFIGNSTIVASNTVFFFDYCSSTVAGNNTPIITFSAGTTSVSFRHYSGGLEVKSMTADHTMSLETDGQLIINADCTGGAISARGNMTITDNSGNVTITQGAALNRDVIADGVWDEILTGATHNIVNSAGRRLRQLEEGQIIHTGTTQAATSLSITLDGTASSVTDFYMHCMVVIVSGTGIAQARRIDTYNGTSKVADILIPWATTPVNGDEYEVIVDDAQHVIHLHTEALDEIADALMDEAVADHVGAGSLGEFIRRIAGLAFDNAAWEFSFTGDNQTAGGIWLYDSAANLATHNKSTGKIGEYAYTCTFSGDKPQVMKISKVS